jgi:DNA-binding MarR family transcriptional regulator
MNSKSTTGVRSSDATRPAPTRAVAEPISDDARAFLDLFYPVHYKIGIGIEDALRGGALGRHQVAILWLIRSEGEGGKCLSRKAIEQSLSRWFEVGSSAISKALRAMSRPPFELLEIGEHPDSGRERLVTLTAHGQREMDRMVARGQQFIQTMVDQLNAVEARQGVQFLGRVSDIIDRTPKWPKEPSGDSGHGA